MLKFTGVGSAFNTALGNTNAFIRKNDSLLLIDCGGTVFERLIKYKILEGIKNLYILITHTHPDHIGSLGDTVFYSYYILKIKPFVIHPDKETLSQILSSMGVSEEIYEFIDSTNYCIEDKTLGKVKLEFLPVSHVENIPAYGIEINYDGQCFFYSGDANDINKHILDGLENGRIKRIYQDTCGADYPGNNHLSQKRLLEIIKPSLRNKVYCIHQDAYFDSDLAIRSGFNIVDEIEDLV
ncbi:MAG: MBL fold metallo-hydrolase [Bacillota bacterium]|nr:MBL fold metallo-hydrolase [Bacillota bacterium]